MESIIKKAGLHRSPFLFYSVASLSSIFKSVSVLYFYFFSRKHSVVQFGTTEYGTVVCVCDCVCKRDRQGGSVGDLAGQGRGRGQIGETKVTLTARVCLCSCVHARSSSPVQLMM